MRQSQLQFIRQQGFSNPDADRHLYAALMLQPRIIAGLVLAGIQAQSPWVFLALSAVLWWSTFVPRSNPFDALYNAVVAHPRRYRPMGVAPAPRRFAEGLAAALALAIGVALLVGARDIAWVCQGLLGSAVAALVFGRFCAGSYLYHLLSRLPFAGRHSASARPQGSC